MQKIMHAGRLRRLFLPFVTGALCLCVCLLWQNSAERQVRQAADAYIQTLCLDRLPKGALSGTAARDSRVSGLQPGSSGGGAGGKSQNGESKNHERDGKNKQEQPAYTGEIDCLLEIPQIQLSRVVVTAGDREENLSHHFFVAGKETMHYGDGSYVIFGHQSFTRNKGFNRLDELKEGDVIYIAGEGFRDAYQVVELVAEQWGEAPEDFTEDTDRLAIYTCKKQKDRPKPYMVVRAKKAS